MKEDVTVLVPEDNADDWTFAENDAKVLRIPRDQYEGIVRFLEHPDNGVRWGRPQRQGETDA